MTDARRAEVISPSVLIDISAVPLTGVHAGGAGFTIGGLARMSDVAADPGLGNVTPVSSSEIVHRRRWLAVSWDCRLEWARGAG